MRCGRQNRMDMPARILVAAPYREMTKGFAVEISVDFGTGEQILDGFADLHESIQTGRLGNELGNPDFLEQRLVAPGPGRTPNADGNAGKVLRGANFAEDLFAGVLGQVQVHQDQVWNCRLRVNPLPADEREGLASGGQVTQFKLEIVLLQRPIEQENVRSVVFDHEDSDGANTRSLFQSYPPAANTTGRRTP